MKSPSVFVLDHCSLLSGFDNDAYCLIVDNETFELMKEVEFDSGHFDDAITQEQDGTPMGESIIKFKRKKHKVFCVPIREAVLEWLEKHCQNEQEEKE